MNAWSIGCLIALHWVPIWAFDHFLTQDGPIHLANTWTFFQYNAPDHELFRDYYVRNTGLTPNWLIQLLLGGLLTLFRPETAEKIVASGFVVLLPLSMVYAIEGVRRGAGSLAVLAFPLIFTWLLAVGLSNFCYGAAIHFFVVGYWLRHRGALDATRMAVLALGFVLLYFTHIVAVMAALVTVGVWIISDGGFRWRPIWTTGVALAPALALTLQFFRDKAQMGAPVMELSPRGERVKGMFLLDDFVAYRVEEGWVFAALAAAIGLLLCAAAVRVVRERAFDWLPPLCVPLVFAALYLVMPIGGLHGGFIPERLLYLAVLSAIVGLGVYPFSLWQKRSIGAAAWMLAGSLLIFEIGSMRALDSDLDEILSCGRALEPNVTVLSVRKGGGPRLDPLRHASSYWALEHGVVSLANFSAYRGNHSLLYRSRVSPLPSIGCLSCETPSIDIPRYLSSTGGRVDYVLAQGFGPDFDPGPNYEPVCTSVPKALARLYRAR